MRHLNLILTPVLMAGIMISGVRLYQDQGKRWLAEWDGDAANVVATVPVATVVPVPEMAQKGAISTSTTPILHPIPDVISQNVTLNAESQRHRANLHPEMITPGNFEYLGAFMPPHFEDNPDSFAYSPGVLTFRPDPDRPETESTLPGSLFLTGHSHHQRVAEISIPKPVLSRLKRVEELPRAELLQPFADVTHGIMQKLADSVNGSDFRLGGLQVVGDRLHWTTHIYYNPGEYDTATHGCCSVDLSQADAEGPWHLGDAVSSAPECHSDKHAGYVFEIPEAEARRWFGGKNLVSGFWTGTGLQNSSHGPALFAYNLPRSLPAGGSIEMLPLVWYPMTRPLSQHHPADHWGGGAWLTLGNKQAVIFAGQKSLGEVYYGVSRVEDCDSYKGYHGTPYEAQLYFYSPASLIHAAHGAMSPNDVQTWMRWTNHSEGGGFDQYLFPRCSRDIGGVAYDRAHSLLYVSQPNAGVAADHPWNPVPLIHVFRIVE